MRKLAVLLLLVWLAVSAWEASAPRTAEQAIGSCVEQRGQEVRFIPCAPRPLLGSVIRGKVVGTSGQLIDPPFANEPPLGPDCPPAADYVVKSPFPSSRDPWLCLDNKRGDTNTRG